MKLYAVAEAGVVQTNTVSDVSNHAKLRWLADRCNFHSTEFKAAERFETLAGEHDAKCVVLDATILCDEFGDPV